MSKVLKEWNCTPDFTVSLALYIIKKENLNWNNLFEALKTVKYAGILSCEEFLTVPGFIALQNEPKI